MFGQISKNCPDMFGPQQTFSKNCNFCLDGPSDPPKNQLYSDRRLASKKCKFTDRFFFFPNTNPFFLTPFLVEMIIWSVNENEILSSHSDCYQASPYKLHSVRTIHQAPTWNFAKIYLDRHLCSPPIIKGPSSVHTARHLFTTHQTHILKKK